jgi:hypothetical protein
MRAPAKRAPAPAAVRAESAMPEVAVTEQVVAARDELQPQERVELREAAPAADPRQEATISAPRGRKRVRWTRDAIVTELASWMTNGSMVDASFMKRHGPPGLVAAALREFGRFDAALNVASLQVARLYSDGPKAR